MELIAEIAKQVSDALDERAARHAYRRSFNRLRSQLQLYPTGERPSEVFENAAATVRPLGASCLPLAVAVAMHLYPFCVLQCVPIPLLSVARLKRAMLLRTIRNRSLILANTGSERSTGTTTPPIATKAADGVRIDGRCEYLSLSSVADIVLFKAQLADSNHAVLCAADLRASSVRIGPWKFSGQMELSDTSSVTFVDHRVPDGHYLIVPDDAGLGCITDYQRSWFHLFIAEIYLARVEHLEGGAKSAEVARLRQQSLNLLDEFAMGADVGPLVRTTAALKLRVSMLSQATAAALRSRGLAAEAAGLGYIKSQPTADAKILKMLSPRREDRQEEFRDFRNQDLASLASWREFIRPSCPQSPAASSLPQQRRPSAPPAAARTDASCA
jgi:alkylation response protein AidB-like acyl-CoA dehydrogenase